MVGMLARPVVAGLLLAKGFGWVRSRLSGALALIRRMKSGGCGGRLDALFGYAEGIKSLWTLKPLCLVAMLEV